MGASVRFGGLKHVREVVIEAVRQDGDALQFASEELTHDRDVLMEAVRQNGDALRFASEELNGDREVVIEAVRQAEWLAYYMCMTCV